MGHATTGFGGTLARVITRQERVLAKRLPAALDGDVKGIHRARVASRRLREALAVSQAVRPKGGAQRARREARRITRALGPVREMDVALQELDRMAHAAAWPAEPAAALRRAIEDERAERCARMQAKAAGVDLDRLRDRCRKLADAAATHADDREWWRRLSSRVVERAGGVVAALAECGTLYAPDRLHRLRIAIKKLRYALELVRDRQALAVRPAINALRRAQRRFGHLHDVQILQIQIQALAVGKRSNADGEHAKILESLERECRQIHARALTYMPEVEASAKAVKREVGARGRSPRLTMAKAVAPGGEPGATAPGVHGPKARHAT
jgi:CHAD domain-containing protein